MYIVGEKPEATVVFRSTRKVITTSNHDLESIEVELFPNPVKEHLFFKYDGSLSDLKLFDVNGKIVYIHNRNNVFKSIDVSHLESGIYFASFLLDKQLITRRVVKL